MRELLLDPRLFNYLICSLYATNALQFFARAAYTSNKIMFWNGCYWVAALSITAVVTWGSLR